MFCCIRFVDDIVFWAIHFMTSLPSVVYDVASYRIPWKTGRTRMGKTQKEIITITRASYESVGIHVADFEWRTHFVREIEMPVNLLLHVANREKKKGRGKLRDSRTPKTVNTHIYTFSTGGRQCFNRLWRNNVIQDH